MDGRIFIDMDGTIAEYRADTGSRYLEKGYFCGLLPYQSMIRATKRLIRDGYDVYILTTVCTIDAILEKESWLDRYLPELSGSRRLYATPDKPKNAFLPGGQHKNDILIDDHTPNLLAWHGTAIKAIHPLNHRKGIWNGETVNVHAADELADRLCRLLNAEKTG